MTNQNDFTPEKQTEVEALAKANNEHYAALQKQWENITPNLSSEPEQVKNRSYISKDGEVLYWIEKVEKPSPWAQIAIEMLKESGWEPPNEPPQT